jgi:hypothetical protein
LQTSHSIRQETKTTEENTRKKTVSKDVPEKFKSNHTEQNKQISYLCDVCEYNTKMKSDLKRHICSMHDMKDSSIKCHQCPYVAKWNGDLRKHISTTHVNKSETQNVGNDFERQTNRGFKKTKSHMSFHAKTLENARYCFYFNNGTCRKDKEDCDFSHKLSPPCKFGKECWTKFCPFKHDTELLKC